MFIHPKRRRELNHVLNSEKLQGESQIYLNDTMKKSQKHTLVTKTVNLYLIETHLNAFANRADPDQAALPRAA